MKVKSSGSVYLKSESVYLKSESVYLKSELVYLKTESVYLKTKPSTMLVIALIIAPASRFTSSSAPSHHLQSLLS